MAAGYACPWTVSTLLWRPRMRYFDNCIQSRGHNSNLMELATRRWRQTIEISENSQRSQADLPPAVGSRQQLLRPASGVRGGERRGGLPHPSTCASSVQSRRRDLLSEPRKIRKHPPSEHYNPPTPISRRPDSKKDRSKYKQGQTSLPATSGNDSPAFWKPVASQPQRN